MYNEPIHKCFNILGNRTKTTNQRNQYIELEYIYIHTYYIKEDFTFNAYVNIYLHTYVHCA